MRFLAWVCLLAVLLAVAVPTGAGPQAILAPAEPVLCEPGAVRLLRTAEHAAPPELHVPRGVPARAPPLA